MLSRMVVNTLISAVMLGLLLFVPAGTLFWPQGWIFLVLFVGSSQAMGIWLLRTDPEAIGALLIVVAFIGWVDVLKANSFASVEIRVQKERGQKVISTGPYAVVRHPMYAYFLPLMIGTSLLLGSLWGLLGLVLIVPLVAVRALGEEAMLLEGLPGYREYTYKVRFRLVPGVW